MTHDTGTPGPIPDKESILFHDLPDMDGVSAVAGCVRASAFARHVHGSHVLGIVDAGLRVVEAGGVETSVGPGRLFAIQAGLGHRCRSGAGAPHAYRAVCLAPWRLSGAAPGLDGGELALPSPLLDDPKAAALLREFFTLLPPMPDSLPRREELAGALALRLARHAVPAGPAQAEREAVRRAVARIEADPAAALPLELLAETACLSPFHFQRLFTAQTGVSPRDWQLACRVRNARALLDRGVPPVEAALACGFADQSHFTKAFRRIMGLPPGRYLRCNPPGPAQPPDKG